MAEKFSHNPFAALSSDDLPASPASSTPGSDQRTHQAPARKNRGRVDIVRQKAGRGGKIVEETLTKMRAIADSVGQTGRQVQELGARSDQIGEIIGVIDVYEAVTTERPYQLAKPVHEAVSVLRDQVKRGWRGDDLVEGFVDLIYSGSLDNFGARKI